MASGTGSRFRTFLPVVVLALLLSACGNDDTAEVGDVEEATTTTIDPLFAAADIQVTAEDIDFPQKQFRAPAGEITIAYRNGGRIRHTLVLEGRDDFDRLEVEGHSEVDSGSVSLEPGEYILFCDVPGHRAAGMEATLAVE